jgi:hypothetical protein
MKMPIKIQISKIDSTRINNIPNYIFEEKIHIPLFNIQKTDWDKN